MLKCIIENAKGDKLEFNDETKYQLYEVDGLHPPYLLYIFCKFLVCL